MDIFGLTIKRRIPQVEIVESNNIDYDFDKVGTLEIPDKLTDINSFILGNTVSELNFPIDFIADRASKLRYYIADKNDKEIENTELNRFINDINPFWSFSDIVYQYIISYLADGNSIINLGVPSALSAKKPTVNNITRLDILQPNLVEFEEYYKISMLNVVTLNDFIKKANYYYDGINKQELNINNIVINNIDSTRKLDSQILSKSPFFKAYRNINNLLATYSARYNVYANNGAAGYLTKKQISNSNGMADVLNPSTREDILNDINNRNGITGKRNFWGISSVPLEFINTLASIKDLMPFEETLENSIKISGVYNLPPTLVTRKDQPTFDNQELAEKSVWENTITSIVETFCTNITKALTLDKVNVKVKADYSSVSALKQNDKDIETTKGLKIDNLQKLKNLNPEIDLSKEIELLINNENGRQREK